MMQLCLITDGQRLILLFDGIPDRTKAGPGRLHYFMARQHLIIVIADAHNCTEIDCVSLLNRTLYPDF